MRGPLTALALGLIAIVTPITAYVYQSQVHEEDVAGISQLRATLDSTRVTLASATTAADSLHLADEIQARERALARREYHVPGRAAQLERWWRPTGFGTLAVAVGTALVVVGLALLRRGKVRRA